MVNMVATETGKNVQENSCNSKQTETKQEAEHRVLRKGSQSFRESERAAKRTCVKHSYHDHLHDPFNDDVPFSLTNDEQIKKQRAPCAFPEKLHKMLDDVDVERNSHIVSWQPHGRCFRIHDKEAFVEEIMPCYFHQSKFTSFQRQLNLYGYVRLTIGKDRGSYYHELFLRSRPDLCKRMVRTRIKGNGMKPVASPATEPNFYAMEYCAGGGGTGNFGACDRRRKQESDQRPPLVSSSGRTEGYLSPNFILEEDMNDCCRTTSTAPAASSGLVHGDCSARAWRAAPSPTLDGPAMISPSSSPSQQPQLGLSELNPIPFLEESTDDDGFANIMPCVSSLDSWDTAATYEKDDQLVGESTNQRDFNQTVPSTPSSDSWNTSPSNRGPSSGDVVLFEGHSFRYLDHLDLEEFIESCPKQCASV